jgi:hypothetical protein
MSYWITRGGQKYGPYSIEDIRRMVAEGSAAATDLAWHEGMSNWAALGEVVSLSDLPASLPTSQLSPDPAVWSQPQTLDAGTISPSGYDTAVPSPMPPDLHWAVVLLLGCVTLGLFLAIWFFVEANFVRKIDQQSKAILLGIFGFAASFLGGIIQMVSLFSGSPSGGGGGFGDLLRLVGGVLCIVAVFNIRKSLLDYYNRIEPINLTLSGVMTFFFGVFYFQHHFSRIATWKKSGCLIPQ